MSRNNQRTLSAKSTNQNKTETVMKQNAKIDTNNRRKQRRRQRNND